MSIGTNCCRSLISCFALIICLMLATPTVCAQRIIGSLGSERDDMIDRALETDIISDNFETTLGDVMHDLSSKLKIPIQLNESAFDNNLDEKTLFTVRLENVSLRSVLRIMLSQFDCTFLVRDGILFVTSEAFASQVYQVRIYDCRSLISKISTEREEASQKLRNVIESTIDPASWNRDAGKGGVAEFGGVLTIRQNPKTHFQIQHLLNQLSETLDQDNSRPGQSDQTDEAQ